MGECSQRHHSSFHSIHPFGYSLKHRQTAEASTGCLDFLLHHDSNDSPMMLPMRSSWMGSGTDMTPSFLRPTPALLPVLWVLVAVLCHNHVQAFMPQSTTRSIHLAHEFPTMFSPPPLRHWGRRRRSRTVAANEIIGMPSSKQQQDISQQPHNGITSIMKRFARSLLKGLALPFPILQKIAFSDGGNNKNQLLDGGENNPSSFSIGITVREGLFALFVYLVFGVVAYTKVFEQWSIVDALYFTSVCFSTVGYGDLSPTNPASQWFTCLFGMVGIAFLGAAVASVGAKVVQAEVTAAQTATQVSRRRLLHLFDVDGKDGHFWHKFRKQQQHRRRMKDRSNSKALLEQQAEQVEEDFREKVQRDQRDGAQQHEATLGAIARRLAIKSLSSLSIIFASGLIMGYLNKAAKPWSIQQSLYFSLVTGKSWLPLRLVTVRS
jgi:Ion channel